MCGPTLGQCRLSGLCTNGQHVVVSGGRKRVILRLKPYELGLEIANTLLEPSHLRDDARVGTTDVPK